MISGKNWLILSLVCLVFGLIGALIFNLSMAWEILTVVTVLVFLVTIVTWLFMRPAVFLPWAFFMVSLGMLFACTL